MTRPALALTAVLVLTATQTLHAQIVRGRVTEVSSGVPVAGALVSLLGETGDSTIVSLLTAASGEYAIRASVAGPYRVSVKRIGVRRFVSDVFTLNDGETRVLDVTLDPIAQALPPVMVSGLCATRPRELARISSLWDEARTALQATEISLRDQLMQARISRYAADLNPTNMRVLFDWRSDAEVMTEQPFTSLSGDSLSAVGYWRVLPGDSVEYLAPDASALASNAFVHDHCFSLASAPRGRPDLIGLAFVPGRERRLPDIQGTIWIDARRFELRFIEFRYTGLPAALPNANLAGGEVHFTRLGSGAWIVDRWFIRMPQTVRNGLFSRQQLREEGGTVVADGVNPTGGTSVVLGVFRDSAGRPAEGAVVRAIGTHHQVVTGADGVYRLEHVPPGRISIVAHTNGHDSFAVLAATSRIELSPGRQQRVDLRARNSRDIRDEACVDPNVRFVQRARTRGALRLLMVDSASAVPMPGVLFLVRWPLRTDESLRRRVPTAPGFEGPDQFQQAVTDERGAATFCDVPYGTNLEVSLVGPSGQRLHVMMVEVASTGITGRVVYGRINR